MDGPFWSFVLDLAPVRRRLRREISQARDQIERDARRVLDKDRATHRAALAAAADKADRDLRDLSTTVRTLESDNRDLSATVRTLESDNRRLRDQVAESREVQRRHDELAAIEARDTTSDLFRCEQPGCGALWLLSMRPDHSYYVSEPIGDGCEICKSNTLLRLLKVKATVTEPDEIARVARPVSTAPALAADLSVPRSGRTARTDIGAKFVVDLMQRGEDAAVANALAHQASTYLQSETDDVAPATRCTRLSAIADGLDQASNVIRDGVAWCATEIFGLPDFLARLLGEVVRRTVELQLAPVHTMHVVAQGIRAFGTVSCVIDDRLGHCQCARHLAAKVGETAVAGELKQVLDRATELSPLDDVASLNPGKRWHNIGGI
ncbi:MAG TPA: hypothetical protein VJ914_19625 [Pseudonocardiaceae bacterium]|nr:hypothetical protein [Pseudonocardiaceae bacterium]